MKEMITVAVDGPAGSGKSSVSKKVAIELGLKYIDSGALYRSITWYVLKRDGMVARDFAFSPDIGTLQLRQEFLPDGSSKSYVNDEDVSLAIRDEQITGNIGIISDDVKVREFINTLLRKWAREESIIMDGRDIGSIVFPDADLKIYLDASAEIRARRRIKEYREMGKNVDENSIKNQIIHRDNQDTTRPYGALVKVDDAVYIDTSNMDIEQVIGTIKDLILQIKKTG